MQTKKIDPKRDLVLERTTDVAPEQIWKALTDPTELKKWFCPKPWQVVEAKLESQPGGIFFCQMQGPNGEKPEAAPGCVLEAIPNRKLVFTDAFTKAWEPSEKPFFTGVA